MTPSARLCAVSEILDSLLQSWLQDRHVPADKLIDQYFKARRYIGSKDRGAISELTYWILRHKASLEWWCDRGNLPRLSRGLLLAALVFRGDFSVTQFAALFDGGQYSPPPLTDGEWQFVHTLTKQPMIHPDMPRWVRLNYPQWLDQLLEKTFGARLEDEIAALSAQAPADLRANTLHVTREELLTQLMAEGYQVVPTPVCPTGIRMEKRDPIFTSPLFKKGYFEMQDEGSQIVSLLVDAKPGMKVIDFCAGAGGKTLAVAAQMENKGRILAWDTSAKRLAQLPLRLKRAGVFNTEWRVITSESDSYIKRHKQTADRVLVDAPCTGSGTWRRNPDLKWRFSQKDLDEMLPLQQRILESASRLVKPGGWLVYATCSLFSEENERQIEQFLKTRSNFRVVCAEKVWNKNSPSGDASAKPPTFLWLTPHQDGVDGFFAAVLERVDGQVA